MADQTFTQRLEDELGQIGAYADDLRGAAQGNHDFIVKFLKRQHDLALGANDQQKAKFIESVSNNVEERVGRIPFDFDLKTDREKQDLNRFYQSQEMQAQDQLAREQEFTQQQQFAGDREQQQIRKGESARGFLGSGVEQGKIQQAEEQRQTFQIDPQQRAFALEKAVRDFGIQGAGIASERRLDDITTGARRGVQDLQFEQEQRREQSQRNLDQQLAQIRAEQQSKELSTRQALSIAEQERILGGF